MSVNKKTNSAGRNIARIVFILMAIIFLGIFSISIYLGGQMKTINKFYTALERNDIKSCLACYAEQSKNSFFLPSDELFRFETPVPEEEFSRYQNNIRLALDIPDDKNFFVKTKFVSRQSIDKNEYHIIVKTTFYNDADYYIEDHCFSMKFEQGKWLIEWMGTVYY